MVKYNYLAFGARLEREGRLKDFEEKRKAIPQDSDYKKNLDILCKEFGITEIITEKPYSRRFGPTGEIYRGNST